MHLKKSICNIISIPYKYFEKYGYKDVDTVQTVKLDTWVLLKLS